MRRSFIFTLLLGFMLTGAYAHRALAQQLPPIPTERYNSIEDIQKFAYFANPKFEAMARAALNEQPPRFNFTDFRRFYALSRQYDPMGEETLKTLLDYAYVMQSAEEEDTPEYIAARDGYQLVIMNHMANLGVVMQAAALARDDARFNMGRDPDFFIWLKDGLIEDLIISGDGNSLQGAYDIITLTEETVLFNQLNLRRIDTVSQNEDQIYYSMHDVEDLDKNMESTVFVNTSIPMRFLKAKAIMEEGFGLPLYKR